MSGQGTVANTFLRDDGPDVALKSVDHCTADARTGGDTGDDESVHIMIGQHTSQGGFKKGAVLVFVDHDVLRQRSDRRRPLVRLRVGEQWA